ncbi:MAG: RsmD family RNA methyltransferase [Bacteroidota bacterium]|nr:RsmD family RNA methyltransferase [Bacteroidota bacterium]
MRIISGIHRGRPIRPPANLPVRPTTDFAKEGLFDILTNRVVFEEIDALDLFAGTGSISYELISRGCRSVLSVDRDPRCVSFIRKTAEMLKAENLEAIRDDVFRFVRTTPGKFDLIFADPPYDLEGIDSLPGLIQQNSLLEKDGIFIFEHSRNLDVRSVTGLFEERHYGNVNFSFFRFP